MTPPPNFAGDSNQEPVTVSDNPEVDGVPDPTLILAPSVPQDVPRSPQKKKRKKSVVKRPCSPNFMTKYRILLAKIRLEKVAERQRRRAQRKRRREAMREAEERTAGTDGCPDARPTGPEGRHDQYGPTPSNIPSDADSQAHWTTTNPIDDLEYILSTPVEGEREEGARLLRLWDSYADAPSYPVLSEMLYYMASEDGRSAPSPTGPSKASQASPQRPLTLSDWAVLSKMTPLSTPPTLHPAACSPPLPSFGLDDGENLNAVCDGDSPGDLCEEQDPEASPSLLPVRQSDSREKLRMESQLEREQGARVTWLGVDNNVLAAREEYTLERFLHQLYSTEAGTVE